MFIYVLLFLNFAFTVFVFVRSVNRERSLIKRTFMRVVEYAISYNNIFSHQIEKLEVSLETLKKNTQTELADIKFNMGQTNGRD